MTIDFKDYQQYFTPLQTRMDASMNLRNLRDYAVLVGEDGEALPNTRQIILNYPRVFSDAVIASLGEDEENREITNADSTVAHKLEELIPDWRDRNDSMLSRQMVEPFNACQDFFITNRGWGAALPLAQYDPVTKLYLITLTPMDARWMMWKVGPRGFDWTLNWVRADKEATAQKYKVEMKGKGRDVNLAVIWTTEEYLIYESTDGSVPIGEKPVFSKNHGLGFCPMVVVPTPLSPEVISTPNGYAQDLSEQGPDVFAPVLKILKYMNEFASIEATITREQFETPLVLTADANANADPMSVDIKDVTVSGYGIKTALPAGMKWIEIPTKDMAASTERLFNRFFQGFEMGAFTSAAFGDAGNREPALVYAERKSTIGKVVNPRRKCKATLNVKCEENIARQIRTGKYWITDIPKDEEYAIDKIPSDLFAKKFRIFISYSSISPQENIVNAQLAAQLHRDLGIPLVDVLRDIMHDPDPEGKSRAAAKEKIKQMSTSAAFAEAALSYAPVKDASQAEIDALMADIVMKDWEKWMEGQQEVSQPPNPASQPKPSDGAAEPNSNKLASMQEQRTGQAAMRKAGQSRIPGGQ